MTQVFYTFEHDGKRMDLEFTDKQKLIEWLDEWFAEKWADEGLRNGETREDEGEIIAYTVDDETGEPVDISREKHALAYEHYHGDFAEHNTYY